MVGHLIALLTHVGGDLTIFLQKFKCLGLGGGGAMGALVID